MIHLLALGACVTDVCGLTRAHATQDVMGEAAKRVEIDALKHGVAPDQASFEALFVPAGPPTDAWGNPLRYEAPGPAGAPFELVSYGEDGAPGGEREARDLRWSALR